MKKGSNPKNSITKLWARFDQEKYDEVIAAAAKYIDSDNEVIRNEAYRLMGLSFFRKGQFDLSQKAFVSLTQTSNNPDDWFNLVTSSTLNKNIELSESAYLKVVEHYNSNATKDNLPLAQIYFYYMQGLKDVKEYTKAFIQLEKLAAIYAELFITDDTFVYLRGIPYLSQTMEASKEILENIDSSLAKKLLKYLIDKVDEEGKQYLKKFEKTIQFSN